MWGFIFLDQLALSIITPYMVKALSLSNGQVGLINMWQAIGSAIAGPLVAIWSDRIGYRKALVVVAVLLTSIFSGLTTFAHSSTSLSIMRFLVGVAEGGIMPIAITMIRLSSSPHRFGRNVRIVYAGASVIAATLGPTMVTQLVAITSWNMAFLLISIPSFVLTFIIWIVARESPRDVKIRSLDLSRGNLVELFKYRNFILCVLICIAFMGGLVIFAAFGPLYLTTVAHLSPQRMGYIWSLWGLVGILWQFTIPIISDYTGRKPAVVIFYLVCAVAPLFMYFFPTSTITLVVLIAVGGTITSMTVFHASIIPVESMPSSLTATGSAIILGIGSLIGAFVTAISGSLADHYGLPIVEMISAVVFILSALIAIFVIETNTRRAQRTDAADTEFVSS